MRRGTAKILGAALAALLLLTALSGCANNAGDTAGAEARYNETPPFETFREIPGVTEREIEAIEALQREYRAFSLGSSLTTEAFIGEDGEIGGYLALLCEWLSGLFDIPFEPVIHTAGETLDMLASLELDFMGNMRITEERRAAYHMTDVISQMRYVTIRLAGSRNAAEIAAERPLRYAFMSGFATQEEVDFISDAVNCEILWANSHAEVYALLQSGAADAFVGANVAEASYDALGAVIVEDLYPLIFSAVAMATANPKLEPVISVIRKAQEHGGLHYTHVLHSAGDRAYSRHKFNMSLSDEERAYIGSHSNVPVAANLDNYPVMFYNEHEAEWQGIFFDLLNEIEALTGMSFHVVNGSDADWPTVYNMVLTGEAAFTGNLHNTSERRGLFLWPETRLMPDFFALISKTEYPDIAFDEVLYVKVGLPKGTSYADKFRQWFPGHTNVAEYETMDIAMQAMRRGEIDMVMASQLRLMLLTHYQELPDFKANIVFTQPIESTFGFHKGEAVLCSIVDKALKAIDTPGICERWMRKTSDYRAKLAEAQRDAQRPLLLGMAGLFLVVFILIMALFFRSRSEGKRLEQQVDEQTMELKTAYEQARVASEEAQTANEAKSQFIANMSHEMRTPMNVVVGLTDLMLDEEDPENTKENLKKINTAGNTLMGLISDVLDISKIEAGKLELMPAQYEVPSNINDLVNLNLIRIEDKPITFQLDIDGSFHRNMVGDDLRIKQILNNLLSNAFKYTRQGSVTLGFESRREGEYLWLDFTVSDTGIGIREEDLGKLFTDYHQVDTRANRKIEGTGLGLSITKRLVELMDGTISVESEYGEGTTFRVRIRQGFVNDETIGEETAENLRGFRYADSKRRAKLARSDLSYARVLLVDDFPTNLDVAAGMLRKYKMQVDCVDNGWAAVQRIASGEPAYDAVFMDHMMPEMDGVEATEQIRAIGTKYARTVPIIALTANAVAGNEQMFLDKGFSAYLAKPINVAVLDSVVQRWVRDKSKE